MVFLCYNIGSCFFKSHFFHIARKINLTEKKVKMSNKTEPIQHFYEFTIRVLGNRKIRRNIKGNQKIVIFP